MKGAKKGKKDAKKRLPQELKNTKIM